MQPGYFGDAGGPIQGINHDLQSKLAAASQYDSVQPTRPNNEIEGCLTRANNAVERLHHRLSALEDRLRPVMLTTVSGSQGTNAAPKESLSLLGDAIRNLGDGADRACDRLEALLNGLAL